MYQAGINKGIILRCTAYQFSRFVVVSVAQFRQYATIRLNEVTKHIEGEVRAGYPCRKDRT